MFDLSGDQRTHLADLRGHEGPVWQVCWAHPRYGSLLASASFDHRVIVWKEGPDGQWQQVRCQPQAAANSQPLAAWLLLLDCWGAACALQQCVQRQHLQGIS